MQHQQTLGVIPCLTHLRNPFKTTMEARPTHPYSQRNGHHVWACPMYDAQTKHWEGGSATPRIIHGKRLFFAGVTFCAESTAKNCIEIK